MSSLGAANRWPKASPLVLALVLLVAPLRSFAVSAGPFGIDHEWRLSDTGIWNRGAQVGLEYGSIAFITAGSLWLGNHDRLGHVFWQSADSAVFAGLTAQVLKFSFSRARPRQGDNPNLWFQGHGYQSFPSGEVTLQAAWVTPFIVDYRRRDPWVWALEALPVYDAIARMKSQAHWQSDVLAGWAIGTAFGYWATTRRVPLLVEILPGGASVGFYKRF